MIYEFPQYNLLRRVLYQVVQSCSYDVKTIVKTNCLLDEIRAVIGWSIYMIYDAVVIPCVCARTLCSKYVKPNIHKVYGRGIQRNKMNNEVDWPSPTELLSILKCIEERETKRKPHHIKYICHNCHSSSIFICSIAIIFISASLSQLDRIINKLHPIFLLNILTIILFFIQSAYFLIIIHNSILIIINSTHFSKTFWFFIPIFSFFNSGSRTH